MELVAEVTGYSRVKSQVISEHREEGLRAFLERIELYFKEVLILLMPRKISPSLFQQGGANRTVDYPHKSLDYFLAGL